jgi:hypothetical protein
VFPFTKWELEGSLFTKKGLEGTPLPEGTVAFPSAKGLRKSPFTKRLGKFPLTKGGLVESLLVKRARKSPFRKGGFRGILWLTLSAILGCVDILTQPDESTHKV